MKSSGETSKCPFLNTGMKYKKSVQTKVYSHRDLQNKNKNSGYILNWVRVISIFLTENHVLRKTVNKNEEVATPYFFNSIGSIDREHFFTYILQFWRYFDVPGPSYSRHKTDFLTEILPLDAPGIWPILNIKQDRNMTIFIWNDWEKNSLSASNMMNFKRGAYDGLSHWRNCLGQPFFVLWRLSVVLLRFW